MVIGELARHTGTNAGVAAPLRHQGLLVSNRIDDGHRAYRADTTWRVRQIRAPCRGDEPVRAGAGAVLRRREGPTLLRCAQHEDGVVGSGPCRRFADPWT